MAVVNQSPYPLFAWFAEYERSTLVERTNAGLARARKEGVKLGRPRASLVKLEEAAQLVAGGASLRSAARAVGLSEATVRRASKAVRESSPQIANVAALDSP